MAVQTSYPGVYVQEVPSGVRTISGVTTSVTAFLGVAKRGPINMAVTITSYSDFERQYGGLSSDSEMSFSVRQFFLNGGTTAIIVRVAGNPVAASVSLTRPISAVATETALQVTAIDAGSEGNKISLGVNYKTANTASLFNLTVDYVSTDNPADSISEVFQNLSMNSQNPRYAVDVVNDENTGSKLIRLSDPGVTALAAVAGSSTSGDLTAAAFVTLIDATHNQFQIRLNGGDPVTVTLIPAVAIATINDVLNTINSALTTAIGAANFSTAVAGGNITITSAITGEFSSVQVLAGAANDVSARLKLGVMFGGQETDGAAQLMPSETPNHAVLTGGPVPLAALTGFGATSHQFMISIDGGIPLPVNLPFLTALNGATVATKLPDLARRITAAVTALKPTNISFSDFTAKANGNKLVLASGRRGKNSSVLVSLAPGDNLALDVQLLMPPATIAFAPDTTLGGGSESPITAANLYSVYTGSQAARTGLYALESLDIFNLLCLPGIEDPGVLMECDAYVQTRRAFLLIDSPSGSLRPSDMTNTISGTALPKSDHAAVFYPWVGISDPLNGGAIRYSAPIGTIAGLMARTDASRGVWKAPAGTEAQLVGVQRLRYRLTDPENGLLNPLAINCHRIFPDAGAVAWGSRTLAGSDANASEWKSIPVRRTALFIEESLFRGLKWVVFEPNDEPLWAQIRLNVGAFMNNLFRQGAFQGKQKDDAYFVKCDSETTTQNDIDLGRVNILVGFAPLKPAEFVILYLQQMAGQIQV